MRPLPMICGALLAGVCGRGSGPPLEPARLESARLDFACEWSPRPPALGRLVVDLRVQSDEGPSAATAADVAAIEAAGGRVLHRFPVAVVRAELDTAAIRRLVAGPAGIAQYATTVRDTSDRRVSVQVFYRRGATPADARALRALGAAAASPLGPQGVIYATLPDSSVAAASRLPGVRFVQARAVGCGTGT